MRPLKDTELEAVLKKLSNYINENVQYLLKRSDGTLYCFRFHRNRVFYVRQDLVKFAVKFGRAQLYSLGTCIGRFTKGWQFLLHITALDLISTLGKHKFCVKPSAEQQFLYGHNVSKAGLLKVSDEHSAQYNGVIVVNKNDLPLGFGISAKSSDQINSAQPGQTICLHQSDLGEYLRDEGHFNL